MDELVVVARPGLQQQDTFAGCHQPVGNGTASRSRAGDDVVENLRHWLRHTA